jgi:SAM-dependent methyltransferase
VTISDHKARVSDIGRRDSTAPTDSAVPAPALDLAAAFAPTDAQSRPNRGPLWLELRELSSLALNVKSFGYELARSLAAALPARSGLEPRRLDLACKPSTQADLESDWAAYWLGEIKVPVVFHRKLWEYAYVLQALHDNDLLRPGARGLGFGCGAEPIGSYLAYRGLEALVTDLAPEAMAAKGWRDSGQHAASREAAFHAHLVDGASFEARVRHRFVDMNAIPDDLSGFDFCWSICALEHLGSIENGLAFIKNAMRTLRPGGVAVHTTEFNFLDDERTIDNWPTVLFQRAHFRRLAEELEALGHHVGLLDFDTGAKPLDRFIDLPPYEHDWGPAMRAHFGGESRHLKLTIDGFASTCFGVIVTKGA